MSYSVHTLNIENHSHIIGRQDGVTGDSIKANDEIVFCAACQSVFLKDSWSYMNNEHCEQSETLDFVPSPIPKLVIRKGDKSNDKLIYEVKDEFRYEVHRVLDILLELKAKYLSISLSLLLIALLWYFVPKEYGIFGQDGALILIFSSVILFLGYIFRNSSENNRTIKEFSELKILETGIIINDKFYYYNQIETIRSNKKKNTHELIIKLKDRRKIIKNLPVRNYERTKPFYIALAWAAQFIELNFYTDNQREHGLLKSIEQNYAGKIWVADNL
ncbi:hypothetical protein WAF17_21495 [Bernardetia sp. ABR2-2B]|uniref:hypothetical protein n=1 Tax=Bernardetia sp. ABR2-2B TaxID=3127472 RepID=UPI0030D27B17